MFQRKVVLYGKKYINCFLNRLCEANLIIIFENHENLLFKIQWNYASSQWVYASHVAKPRTESWRKEISLCLRYYWILQGAFWLHSCLLVSDLEKVPFKFSVLQCDTKYVTSNSSATQT